MKYHTFSEITIPCHNMDHATAIRKFLNEAFQMARNGGDFEMSATACGKTIKRGIGHDVCIMNVFHSMHVDDAVSEIGSAREREKQSLISQIKEL